MADMRVERSWRAVEADAGSREQGGVGRGGADKWCHRSGRNEQRIAAAALRGRHEAGGRGRRAAGRNGDGDVAEAERRVGRWRRIAASEGRRDPGADGVRKGRDLGGTRGGDPRS